jgi:membrane associated rhomboid family serine protease
MGIYDREYYRREGPGFLGSFTDRGQVCKWLIGINIVCFILQLVTQQNPHVGVAPDGEFVRIQGSAPFTDAFMLDAGAVLHGQIWRLLTYAFLHEPVTSGLPLHIIFNMLFLWWFGSDVEDIYGPREFLAIYLTSAVLGGLAFVLAWKAVAGGQFCLGASGAVMAVMVLCALHYPGRLIYIFFFLPVPIWLFVVFEVAQDAFGFLSPGHAGNTAVTVHLAGAFFAFCYYKRHWRLMPLWSQLRSFLRQRTRPRLRVYREEPRQKMPVSAQPDAGGDDQLEAKLDAVLEKVARSGKSSLTDSEQQILLRASEVYRRRRT